MSWIKRLMRRRVPLNREEQLELHILETAASAARSGKPCLVPDLDGYSRTEINAKTRELMDRGLLIADPVRGGHG